MVSMPVTPASYEAEDITVLEGLEPVRLRPGMFIGSTGTIRVAPPDLGGGGQRRRRGDGGVSAPALA